MISHSDYFKVFMDRQKFTIPFIGLSCYADDIYLIGCFGLLILLTYSFFSIRRENRIMQRIEKSINYVWEKDPKDYLHTHNYSSQEISLIKHNLLEFIFFGCVEFFIFNTGLNSPDRVIPESVNKKKKKIDTSNTSGRLTLAISYYLPIFAILFSMFFEIKSVIDRNNYFSSSDWKEIKIRYVITIILFVVICMQCIWIRKLNKDNSTLIDQMFKKILESRKNNGLD